MSQKFQSIPSFLHRSAIVDGLQALRLAQYNFSNIQKNEIYACGYNEGYESALRAMAQMMGVFDDFLAQCNQHDIRQLNRMISLPKSSE
ncbi:MAG: hypothetical protein FOGNACKC_05824 [Anaerolineae bacterium]|nr:hypothetical protein [Anaerolineae bacterium]